MRAVRGGAVAPAFRSVGGLSRHDRHQISGCSAEPPEALDPEPRLEQRHGKRGGRRDRGSIEPSQGFNRRRQGQLGGQYRLGIARSQGC